MVITALRLILYMKKSLKIFLFLLCFCTSAIAHGLLEFSVVGFEEKPFDTSARDERYKTTDSNGEFLSIIKQVLTTLDDDLSAYSFDFGFCDSRIKQTDGECKNFGSWTSNYKPGFYHVECCKQNHKSTVETIEVKEGGTKKVVFKAPLPIIRTLDIESKPRLATVAIDGKEYGKIPIEITDLLIGSHMLYVSKEGHKTNTQTVDTRESETTEQSVALEKDVVRKPEIARTPMVEPAKKKEKTTVKRDRLYGYYVELAGNVGHLMDIGLNAGAYFSHFNIEAYGNYGLQKGEFYTLYKVFTVMPVSFGGRVGVGIPAGMSFRFTPQFGAGGLMVAGDETCAFATTLSLGVRCEWECLGRFGISVTPEYAWAIKSDVMKRLTSVCPVAGRWCSGFGARFGIFFKF